ncbi:MAG: DUF1684 domain-containing protein [Anaerolineae bacterium]
MLDLYDYRQRVFGLYARIRALGTDSPEAFETFRKERDDLFAHHPQSPLDNVQKKHFAGLSYAPYDPAFRLVAPVNTQVEPVTLGIDLGTQGAFQLRRFGQVTVTLPTGMSTLDVYWILGYGGGIFLPFRDTTNGHTTYGGGRYLYDTIKGADLGITGRQMVLDFNYAYHPSCAYHPRWTCPLAPPGNRLDIAIPVGEQLPRLTTG